MKTCGTIKPSLCLMAFAIFLLCFMPYTPLLYTAVLFLCVPESFSLWPPLSLTLSFSRSGSSPPPPPGQIQCRCSYLSIMKRGGGEHTAFVLNRGWIIHPVEECLSTLRVCVHTFVCVFVSARLNMVLLYIVVVCMEMFFGGLFLTTTTQLFSFFSASCMWHFGRC